MIQLGEADHHLVTIDTMKIAALRYGLAVTMALVCTAIFTLNYFHEGTSISKYITKQSELERAKEGEVISYTDMMLYGDEMTEVSKDVDLSEEAGSEDGFIQTQRIRAVDQWVMTALMVVAWLMLIPILHRQRALSFVYVVMGSYIFLLSLCKMLNGGAAFSDWAIPAHATRWLPCFALWLWLYLKPKDGVDSYRVVRWMLVIAVSMTFATHGVETLLIHPEFRDLLIGGFEMVSVTIPDSGCVILLRVIGGMDVTLAILVIFIQRKSLFLWMAIWGCLTALSRPIALGDIWWADALLRCGNCFVPLIIYFWIHQHNKSTQEKIIKNDNAKYN